MSESTAADGLFVRCTLCTRLALLPYTNQGRDMVSTREIRGWVLRSVGVICDRCQDPWSDPAVVDMFEASKGEDMTPEMEQHVSQRYGREFENKALGIMLSSGRRPVKIVCDDGLDQVLLYDDDRLLLSLDRVAFDQLTVHDILTRAGVTIHE